jgi:hypothetical protein
MRSGSMHSPDTSQVGFRGDPPSERCSGRLRPECSSDKNTRLLWRKGWKSGSAIHAHGVSNVVARVGVQFARPMELVRD